MNNDLRLCYCTKTTDRVCEFVSSSWVSCKTATDDPSRYTYASCFPIDTCPGPCMSSPNLNLLWLSDLQ